MGKGGGVTLVLWIHSGVNVIATQQVLTQGTWKNLTITEFTPLKCWHGLGPDLVCCDTCIFRWWRGFQVFTQWCNIPDECLMTLHEGIWWRCTTLPYFCCWPPYADHMGPVIAKNWFFPNGTRVSSSGDIYRTRVWHSVCTAGKVERLESSIVQLVSVLQKWVPPVSELEK